MCNFNCRISKNVISSLMIITICMLMSSCFDTRPNHNFRSHTYAKPVIQMNLPSLHEAVRKLPSGNWQVTYTLPYVPSEYFQKKYYIYYAALYAQTIGCHKFDEQPGSFRIQESGKKTYECLDEKYKGIPMTHNITVDVLEEGPPQQ